MCGILYSQDSKGFSDLDTLKRRGPEGFTELENDYGYSDKETIADVVKNEVSRLVSYETEDLRVKFLWPESPQLYIITLIRKL